jgi:imidazole glycerol-phosphate synthase subunit HisH
MSSPSVTIVDYQLGNLFSVRKACDLLGCPAALSSEAKDIASADALILPGVGAFGQAMENLRRLDLIHPLLDHVAAGKPLFGICLGLQLLFESSEEFGTPNGLGILRGQVRRLPVSESPVPQIGWNRIQPGPARAGSWAGTPLSSVSPDAWMYFVHSYYVENSDPQDALCVTGYSGFQYTSAALRGSVFATQFHPEKSSHSGLEIYRHWLSSLS